MVSNYLTRDLKTKKGKSLLETVILDFQSMISIQKRRLQTTDRRHIGI